MALHKKIEKIPFDYIIPIQVGAALTDEKLTHLNDKTGINISEKNRQFCELTALYWMWKNTNNNYLGLCHYRRFFNMPQEKEILKTLQNDMIILPKRIFFKKTVYEQYKDCHGTQEWDIMVDTLKSMYPDYLKPAESVFSANSIIPYNMFIACKKWVKDYCSWLFPILFCINQRMEAINPSKERYIGFLAERLLTVYVIKNDFKIQEIEIINSNQKIIKQSHLGKAVRTVFFKLRSYQKGRK